MSDYVLFGLPVAVVICVSIISKLVVSLLDRRIRGDKIFLASLLLIYNFVIFAAAIVLIIRDISEDPIKLFYSLFFTLIINLSISFAVYKIVISPIKRRPRSTSNTAFQNDGRSESDRHKQGANGENDTESTESVP